MAVSPTRHTSAGTAKNKQTKKLLKEAEQRIWSLKEPKDEELRVARQKENPLKINKLHQFEESGKTLLNL